MNCSTKKWMHCQNFSRCVFFWFLFFPFGISSRTIYQFIDFGACKKTFLYHSCIFAESTKSGYLRDICNSHTIFFLSAAFHFSTVNQVIRTSIYFMGMSNKRAPWYVEVFDSLYHLTILELWSIVKAQKGQTSKQIKGDRSQ